MKTDLIDQLGLQEFVNDGIVAHAVSSSGVKREPMTAAAFNVCLASGRSRSMRAAMVACNVAGTLTSATSVIDMYAPRCPQYSALGEFADDLFGEERVTGGPVGDRLAQPADRGVRPEQPSDQCCRL